MVKAKWITVFLAFFFWSSALVGTVWAEGNINILYGQKTLSSGDWDPADTQDEYGFMFDFRANNWPVAIAIDYLSGKDDETVSGITLESKTQEINIGIRKYWPITNKFKPYLGGGIAQIDAEAIASLGGRNSSGSDGNIGFWINGGLAYTIANHFNIGADIRFSQAEITINGVSGEAGGTHILVFAGFHF